MVKTQTEDPFKKIRSIHIIGIGGSATLGVAEYLLNCGFQVSGSDMVCGPHTKNLEKLGIRVYPSHLASNIEAQSPDLVLMTPAVVSQDPKNPELIEAKRQSIPVYSWQQFLGEWFNQQGKKGMMVAGAGGKGTTASILTYILVEAGLDPLAILGATFREWGKNYFLGKGNYFILEADEFNYNFLNYHPQNVVITSLVYDHPETYKDFTEYQKGFARFVWGMKDPRFLVLHREDSLLNFAQKYLKKFPGEIITYGEDKKADFRLANLKLKSRQLCFDAYDQGRLLGNFNIRPPCHFNALNALGALVLSLKMGIPIRIIQSALSRYQGLKQRFEIERSVKGITLIFDYAHAPRAIKASLSCAKKIFPNRRLITVFQPHMYSRTYRFLKNYAQSFSAVDKVILMDIFPSRELGTEREKLVHTKDLYKLLKREHPDCEYIPNPLENVVISVKRTAKPSDVFIFLGAGSIKRIYGKVIKEFGRKSRVRSHG
jgi:UDP-N-acetylmuramate--alanine ligase